MAYGCVEGYLSPIATEWARFEWRVDDFFGAKSRFNSNYTSWIGLNGLEQSKQFLDLMCHAVAMALMKIRSQTCSVGSGRAMLDQLIGL